MTTSVWDHSSYLDLVGSGVTDARTPEAAFGITTSRAYAGTLTIGLVLPRVSDPTALLAGSYAQREAVLDGLTREQVGDRFGADPARFGTLTAYLGTVDGVSLSTPTLVSSAAARTLWITVDSHAFETLFDKALRVSATGGPFWDGNLTPNAALADLAGLWSLGPVGSVRPTVQHSDGIALVNGPQGIANTAGDGYRTSNKLAAHVRAYPSQIAHGYHFPQQAIGLKDLTTPAIGLIQPHFGNAVQAGNDPDTLVQAFRERAGVVGRGTWSEGTIEGPLIVPDNPERSLDIGVVATAAPNSDIVTYGGPGFSTYAAIEEAIWADGPRLGQLSTSYGYYERPAAGSPFAAALQGLYADAALNNITMLTPAGDGGSSGEIGTGGPNVVGAFDSPYNLVVGGTSTSNQAQILAADAATTDDGLPNVNAGVAGLLTRAIGGEVGALQVLVAGGLVRMVSPTSNVQAVLQTAWNEFIYQADTNTLSVSYLRNHATGGGVDPNIPEPAYQLAAGIDTRAIQQRDGITPATSAARGVPDVSALAGGNEEYRIPGINLAGELFSGGTSASTPLWAALLAQVQAVFADQGLPTLGTVNDLIYQAATVAPGAFDDVQFGSNVSSFVVGGQAPVTTATKASTADHPQTVSITPTGIGFTAGRGYDLVSGLGTPDGLLLARAMSQIAHAQIYGLAARPVADDTGTTSLADQMLIVQPTITTSSPIGLGGTTFVPASSGSGQAWSARIAQKALQPFFDPALAEAIAGQAQASSTEIVVAQGQSLPVSIGGATASAVSSAFTAPFGFVNYVAGDQSVTLARPIATAKTFGGQDGTTAIVRLRQETPDDVQLFFYRVDDLRGRVNGLAPGQAGYAAAAQTRLYRTITGAIGVGGPGQGGFRQAGLVDVDNGDLIAFRLLDRTTGTMSWGLAGENVGGGNDLWSYGADTWGFDARGGGAFDSLVFQLDFTSAAGHGELVGPTGTVPHVLSIDAAAAPPDPTRQERAITLTLRTSDAVYLTLAADGARPTLSFRDGTVATLDAAASSGTTLTFRAVVNAATALIDPRLFLNGAVLQDGAGVHLADGDLSAIHWAGLTQIVDAPGPVADTLPVFRFFDPSSGSHFYTASNEERTALLLTRPDLRPEGANGVGLRAVDPNGADAIASPVFRFFDTVHGSQFLTFSSTERDSLLASRQDLVLESGSSFLEHAQPQPGDAPVWRFFNSVDGTHLYTDSAIECAAIQQARPDFVDEGISFYEPGRAV